MATPTYIQIRFNAFVTYGVGPVLISINRASPTGTKNGRNIYNNDDLKFVQAGADTLLLDTHELLMQDSLIISKSKQENGLILTTDLNEIVLDSPLVFTGTVDGTPVSFDLYSELSTLFNWHLYDDQAKYRIRIIRQRPDLTFEHLFIGDFRRKDYKFSNRGITSNPESTTELSQKQVTVHAAPLVQALKDLQVSDLSWSLSDMQDAANQTPFYTGMRVGHWTTQQPNGDPYAPGVAFHQLLVDYATGKNPKFNNSQGARATAILSYTPGGTVANGETVTIDSKVYTFQTTLSGGNGHVQLGAAGDPAASLINLLYAINATPNQSGIAYDAATTKHTTVECDPSQTSTIGVTSNQLTVNAIIGGTPGNSIAVSETSADLQWNTNTLTGGSTSPTFDPPTYATFGFDVVQTVIAGLITVGPPLQALFQPPVFPAGIHGVNFYTIFNKLLTHPDVDITISGYDDLPLKGFSQLWNGGGWTIDESTPVNDPLLTYAVWNTLFGLDPNIGYAISTATNTTPIVVTLANFAPPATSLDINISQQDTIVVSGVTGNDGANGTWAVQITDLTHPEKLTLVGSVGTGAGTGGIIGKIISTPVTYSPDNLFFDVFRDFLLQTGYVAECGSDIDGNPTVYLRDRRSINGVSIPTSFRTHVVGDTKPTTEEEFIPPPSLTLRYKGDDDYIIVDHRPLPDDVKIDLTIPLRTHAFADVTGDVYGRHLVYNSKIPIDQQINAQFQRNTSYNLDNVPNGWLPGAFMYRNWPTNETGSLVFPPSQPSQGVSANPSWIGNFAINIVQNKNDISERTKLGFNYGESHLYTLAQFYANALNIRPVRSVTRTYSKITDNSGNINWLKPGVADSFFWDSANRDWESIKMIIDLKHPSVSITYVEQPDYDTLDEYKIITISASNSSGGGASSATDGGSGGANPPGTTTAITDYAATDPKSNTRNDIYPSLGNKISLGLRPNTVTSEIAFYELLANGTNYTSLKGADSQAGNTTYILPNAYPAGTYVLESDVSGNLSWADPASLISTALIKAPNSLTRNDSQPTNDSYKALGLLQHSGTQSASLLESQNSTGATVLSGIDNLGGYFTNIQKAFTLNPFGVSAGNTGELRFLELAANGTNYISLKAPDSLAVNNNYTLPSAYPGVSGYALVSTTAGVLSWAAMSGGISIGDLIGSAVNYEILNVDGSGNLSQIPLTATTNYILTSNGTGSAPTFQNGALVFVNITPTVSSPNNIQPSATGVIPLQLKTATASTSKAFNVISDASADFFNITYQGIVNTYLGLSLNGASNPLSLNGSAGTSGYALISQGAGATPIWYDLGTAITGTQYSLLAGTGSPGVHSIPVPSQTGMVLNSQPAFYPSWTETPHLGKNGTNEGIIYFEALTTGNVQLAVPHSVTSYIFTLPSTAGTNGYLLQTDGSGNISYVNPTSVGMSNPMTTLGDIIYENVTPAPARLAGNTTTNKKFLTQTGTGTISAVPGWNAILFTRGGVQVNPSGLTNAINIIVWRAPFACTVTNVRGYRVGGTGATINARLNGTSNHLGSALSLTSADTWMDGGSVSNTAYAAGDKLEIMLVTVAGGPTQIMVEVDFTT